MMKLISEYNVQPGVVNLGPARALRVVTISGTVTAKFDDEQVTLTSGFAVELPLGMKFRNVRIFCANGASAVLLYGMASLGTSSSGGAGLYGSGAPTTAATAGTTYYDTASGSFYVNADGTATGWAQLIA